MIDTPTDSGVIDLISSFLGPVELDPQPTSNAASNANNQIAAIQSKSISQIDSVSARVIIFSKDRPWQLQQLLLSMKLPSDGNFRCSSIVRVDIHIIIHASHLDFRRGYGTVIQSIEKDCAKWRVHFHFEGDISLSTESDHFSRLLRHTLLKDVDSSLQSTDLFCTSSANYEQHDSKELVMFLTDDCVLLEPLETILQCAIGSLANNSQIFNFVSRLHPGISWSQTRDLPSPPPRNNFRYQSINPNEGVYLYNRNLASVEWNYPFDLSGGVYLRSDVVWLIDNVGSDGLSHPNLFETKGNEALCNNSLSCSLSQKPLSAIPTRPMLVILAMNRVQDVYNAPLAVQSGNSTEFDVDPSNTLDLLKLLDGGIYLDAERYKSTLYYASHIGDMFVCDEKDTTAETEAAAQTRPKLSVLIPVHSCQSDLAAHAIISIIMQPFDESDKTLILNSQGASELLPMQIVIVDDRCTDGSIDAMVNTAKELASLLGCSICMRHLADSDDTTAMNISSLFGNACSITIDIVKSPRPGVASALNHGLEHCQSEIIARMDADDVSAPNRLLSQLRFMQANPAYNVVGTSTVLFSSSNDTEAESISELPYQRTCNELGVSSVERYKGFGTSLFVSDPGFVAWSMLFSCTIQHPSVMFRKGAVDDAAGYNEAVSCCEDYDLWLRLTEKDCHSVTNLPILGLWHRKHRQSKSVTQSEHQKKEADIASHEAIMRLIESAGGKCNAVTVNNISILRNPSSAKTRDDVDAAAFLLEVIERVFLEVHTDRLTSQEVELIRIDVDNRIAQLVEKYVNKSMAWKIWCKRCPDKQLERLSLICHSNQ
ncbi:hypothetical protein ACHAWO_013619 [Cyclotella atomus]|uniref:Glycosyltransferase 2-like domain-containing protein n=1 Tax=Cyclotella atomus TaxID=382360 RepID=A0ABD3PT45_9STRA